MIKNATWLNAGYRQYLFSACCQMYHTNFQVNGLFLLIRLIIAYCFCVFPPLMWSPEADLVSDLHITYSWHWGCCFKWTFFYQKETDMLLNSLHFHLSSLFTFLEIFWGMKLLFSDSISVEKCFNKLSSTATQRLNSRPIQI